MRCCTELDIFKQFLESQFIITNNPEDRVSKQRLSELFNANYTKDDMKVTPDTIRGEFDRLGIKWKCSYRDPEGNKGTFICIQEKTTDKLAQKQKELDEKLIIDTKNIPEIKKPSIEDEINNAINDPNITTFIKSKQPLDTTAEEKEIEELLKSKS